MCAMRRSLELAVRAGDCLELGPPKAHDVGFSIRNDLSRQAGTLALCASIASGLAAEGLAGAMDFVLGRSEASETP